MVPGITPHVMTHNTNLYIFKLLSAEVLVRKMNNITKNLCKGDKNKQDTVLFLKKIL